MSLDLYVMSIRRFKMGDIGSPIASLGLEPTVVGLDGSMRKGGRRRPSLAARIKAELATRRLRREIEAEIGHRVWWHDRGDVAFRMQVSCGFETLRAFAKWLDFRDLMPTFDPPPDGNFYNHPVMKREFDRPLTFPQLVLHGCHTGYYLPTVLERVVYVEPFRVMNTKFVFKRSVGSASILLAELERLGDALECGDTYEWSEEDPLRFARGAYVALLEAARVSRTANLPIVFDG